MSPVGGDIFALDLGLQLRTHLFGSPVDGFGVDSPDILYESLMVADVPAEHPLRIVLLFQALPGSDGLSNVILVLSERGVTSRLESWKRELGFIINGLFDLIKCL